MRKLPITLAIVLGAVLVVVMSGSVSWADSPMAKSLYRGKYWTPTLSDCREAIMRRESNFNYRAANPTSSARGAYQFLDRSWRESLVHMLRPEVKRDYPHRRETLESLTGKSIHKWPRWYQDAAWYTVVVKHDGVHHWSPVPSACR